MKCLETAGGFDGLDMCNCACLELLIRQAQLIEYTYHQELYTAPKKGKGKGRAGLIEESDIFAGTHRDSGELMCAPDLLDYVSKEVERDAAVLKQIRKAREERTALAGSKKSED